MTIIIALDDCLVSDRAVSIENHTFETLKAYSRGSFAWALTGEGPSRPMLHASSVDELLAQFEREGSTRPEDVLVVLHPGGIAEQFWFSRLKDDEPSGTLARRALEWAAAVGCYRNEWTRYRAAHRDVDAHLLASEFIRLVHDMNGLGPNVQADHTYLGPHVRADRGQEKGD